MFKDKKITIFTFFLMTVLSISVKTYFAYYIDLSLGVKGIVQNMILLLNPYSLVALILSTLLFFKGRKAFWLIFTGGTLLTLLLYSNVVYFRFFSDFLTFSTLNQVSNVESMSGALWSSFQWYDFVYFLDTIVYLVLLTVKSDVLSNQSFKRKFVPVMMGVSIALFFINLAFAEMDRPELLTRTFDHKYLVKYLGPYNFTVYDGVKTIQNNQQKAMASADDLTRLQSYTKTKYAEPNKKYFGIAKEKNIIKIHLESFQTEMIGLKVNGKEVTPYLNQLATGNDDFIYYSNFFHSTGQGKTSDAELTMDNSMYGLQQGSAFSLKSDNTFQSLPAILHQKQNYSTSVMHGDYKTFWNRDQIYKRFGIDKFYDATYYDMSEKNLENLGLKDKEFFKESIPYLKKETHPFYSHLITLTNHYPFTVDPSEATIPSPNTGDTTVDGYVQTARYLDESVRQFISDLKKNGLYDNSVIMIYGDHYGISENHLKAMGQLIGENVTPTKFMDLQRTGLFLKVPGIKGHVDPTYASQVDVMPTILHLTGIDAKPYTIFGTDLLSKKHREVVVFRNGDFITPEIKSINGVFYDNKTNEQLIDKKLIAKATTIKNTVATELEMSDSLLNGDLLRFYNNKAFSKINPADYDYRNGTVSSMK